MKKSLQLAFGTLIACAAACADSTEPVVDAASTASAPGLLLISPLKDKKAYLLDETGGVVHEWESEYPPGNSVYLLDDGDLLRCARVGENPVFRGGGEGGRIQRFSWDGELEWDFLWSDETRLAHHDIAPLPGGNVLLISWGEKSRDEVLAAGMDPELLQGDSLWPDSIYEVRPEGATGGEVVWEWHLWDHLIQEFDPERDNYGVVADHPELVDLNAHGHRAQKSEEEQRAELEHMAAIGYAGDVEPDEPAQDVQPSQGHRGGGEDFCHTNGIDYNEKLDQIVVSIRTFGELWVIDHSTTTEEAASHSGGRSGKGGDLLYRWGNPINYGRGVAEHQQLFKQHDARWIPEGFPGAGHLLVFNNGGSPDDDYSTVVEIAPPVDGDGRYSLEDGEPFGPQLPAWEYKAANPQDFYSSFISGAERLPNGNTLICSGESGKVFEVTQGHEIVWEYQNEFGELDDEGGPGGRRGPPGPGGDRRGPGGPGGAPADGRPEPRDGPPPSDRGGPPPGDGRPPRGGGPGGRGGRGGGRGGPKAKSLFRATRIELDHPGLSRLEVPLAGRSASLGSK